MRNYIFPLLLLVLTFAACDGPDENPCENDFDQKAMFMNMANNLIIPAFTELKTNVDNLSDATTDFVASPDFGTLSALQNRWYWAYLSWQSAAQYNFGPAEEVFLRSSVNNFPLDTTAVLDNIQAGNYDFNQPDAFDKGFPALDYLLHGMGIGVSNSKILERYTTNTDATKYIQYLTDVVADIKLRVDHTYDGWTTGGYEETFINNTGTAAGTSLSLIVNNFNENYELIKREKVGIPSGVLTLGFTNPDRVEAYYSGRSIDMLAHAFEAANQFYFGGNGQGLDDFLSHINATKSNGESLDEAIKNQFAAARADIVALSGFLSEQVDSNTAAIEQLYNSLSAQLVNIKTDLPSVLCVSITYIDNPSDSD